MTIRLKSDGSSTYDDIYNKIGLLKDRFLLGYNNIPTMEGELSKINNYVEESIVLSDNEKAKLIDESRKLKQELPELNKERNLPYNKSVNTIKLLEEDFLEDSFWRPTPDELEQSYLRVLNILKNNNELSNSEKAMLKEFVSQKISEIPKLTERREIEEKANAVEKKAAIERAKERYKKQSFFTKAKQVFITKESLKNMEDYFEVMDNEAIDELYIPKRK